MKLFAVNALVSLFVVAVGIAAYHHLVRSPADRIGVIDVTEVYRLKEKAFTDVVTKVGASETDKDKAMSEAQAFAKALTVPLSNYEIVTIVGESSKRAWDLEPAQRVLGYSPSFNLDDLGVPFADLFPSSGS